MTIIQINTFVKIGSLNSFKSWLLAIRLVSSQLCSISSNTSRETLASTSQSPVLPRYLQFCKFFQKIIVSIISLEEVIIIIKFLIEIYKELCQLFTIFTNGSSQPCSPCNVLEKSLLQYQGSFFINLQAYVENPKYTKITWVFNAQLYKFIYSYIIAMYCLLFNKSHSYNFLLYRVGFDQLSNFGKTSLGSFIMQICIYQL